MSGMLLTAAAEASTITGLLTMATEVVGWFITTMGSYLAFITENPIILMLFLILLAGSGIAFLFRIWHSA